MHVSTAQTSTPPARMPCAGADAGADIPALVFRTALCGAAWASWAGRRVRLDEDSWLVLDFRKACTSWSDRRGDGQLLSVAVFADELQAARVAAGAGGGDAVSFHPAAAGEVGLTDSLRSMDGPVGRRLRAIAVGRAAGRRGEAERADRIALAGEALEEERALHRRAERLPCAKPSTREALLRRILVAADFIATHHDEPLSLDRMARAASLSRFHFVRLFKLVHGLTPHAFLLQKRTAVARRHLAGGSGCSDVCTRAGFGSRSALFRNLRKAPPAGGPSSCSLSA